MNLETLAASVDRYRATAESAIERLSARVASAESVAIEAAKIANRPGHATTANPNQPEALRKSREVVREFMRKGGTRQLADFEGKTLSVGLDPEGGYSVTAALSAQITQRIYEVSPFRSLARIVQVDRTDAFEELVDRTEFAAEWVSETQPRLPTNTADLAKFRVPVNEMHASPQATQQLIDDSSIDIALWIEAKLANKFARMEAGAFINGDGIGKPMGLLTGPNATTADATRPWGTLQYVSTGASGAFASSAPADCLIELVYSLLPSYRDRASWIMPRDVARRIRQIKDGEGRYVWEMSVARGQPDRLLGFPVTYVEDMPAIGAGSLSVAFGDFSSAYVIVDRKDIVIVRDPYTAKPFVTFYTTRRVGGGLFNSEAVKLLKFAAS